MANDHDAKVKRSLEYAQQVAAGERCEECGQFVYPKGGGPKKCYGCNRLTTSDEEIAHHSRVRCPYCRSMFDPDPECLTYGSHAIHCTGCNRDFEIHTSVRFSFLSPKMEAPADAQ